MVIETADQVVNFGINLSYTALLPTRVVAATPGLVLNLNKFSFLIGPRTYLSNNYNDKTNVPDVVAEWIRLCSMPGYYKHHAVSSPGPVNSGIAIF